MTESARKPRNDWQDAETVYVQRPRCPVCSHAGTFVSRVRRGRLRRVHIPAFELARSEANGDGSTTQYAICRSCRAPVKLVLEVDEIEAEFPTVGNPGDHVE